MDQNWIKIGTNLKKAQKKLEQIGTYIKNIGTILDTKLEQY